MSFWRSARGELRMYGQVTADTEDNPTRKGSDPPECLMINLSTRRRRRESGTMKYQVINYKSLPEATMWHSCNPALKIPAAASEIGFHTNLIISHWQFVYINC